MLVALEELNFGGCISLMKFPEGLRGLVDLMKLYMCKCETLEEVQTGVCTLMALEEFSFGGCMSLNLIPERVGGLTFLMKVLFCISIYCHFQMFDTFCIFISIGLQKWDSHFQGCEQPLNLVNVHQSKFVQKVTMSRLVHENYDFTKTRLLTFSYRVVF